MAESEMMLLVRMAEAMRTHLSPQEEIYVANAVFEHPDRFAALLCSSTGKMTELEFASLALRWAKRIRAGGSA